MQTISATLLGRAAGAFVAGLLAGTLGTVMHRAVRPWGLVLVLALVLLVTLTCRAWAGWFGYVGAVGGTFLAAQVLSGTGPGGDVLVPSDDVWGWAWAIGSVAAAGVVAFAPRRWVEDDEDGDGPGVRVPGTDGP